MPRLNPHASSTFQTSLAVTISYRFGPLPSLRYPSVEYHPRSSCPRLHYVIIFPAAMTLGPYWNLQVDRYDNVYVITMKKAPENRINVRFAQEIIKALRDIERELGPDSEGCVITRGNDEKFWCTGLELDEADTNPFANSDGFYPVRILHAT